MNFVKTRFLVLFCVEFPASHIIEGIFLFKWNNNALLTPACLIVYFIFAILSSFKKREKIFFHNCNAQTRKDYHIQKRESLFQGL